MQQSALRLCACVFRQNLLKGAGVTCVRTLVCGSPNYSSSSSSSSSSSNDSRTPKVTLSPDGSTYLCWHPETTFPYEDTKPMPRDRPENQEGDSALKVQYLREEKNKYRLTGPNDKELAKMFYTTRHPWDPKPRSRYRRKVEYDREGI